MPVLDINYSNFFAPKHDSDYYEKQLQEISRNKGELRQDFCNRVSLLSQ